MKLKTLLKDLPDVQIKGSKELEVSGITSNSKLVSPGSLFIAKKGRTVDGSSYIHEAISNGAVAILTDIYDPTLKKIAQLIYPEVADIEAKVVASYYQHPANSLWMVGVTGTNGKTTTSFAIKHLLDTTQEPCGLIGTIEYVVGSRRYTANRTTPDVCANHKFLRGMLNEGCKACVMEVTSHALDQGRVENIAFDVGVFTNFSHEHLDYHKSMEEYFRAKVKLFSHLKESGVALLNADDPWVIRAKEAITSSILTYGIEQPADIRATSISFDYDQSRFTVEYKGESVEFFWPLVGRFNVYNALSVIGVGIAKGLSLQAIQKSLSSFSTAPGRLEKVPNSLGVHIYVDYAHKPEALRNVLQTLKELATGRIITLFGCGGDRDREKRPIMAKVSEELSDITIVTSDNPRSEEPEKIIQEILKGFQKNNYHVEPDRKLAIEHGLRIAKENDMVLIAGKGHEAQQIFATKTIDFDDRLIARQLAEELAQEFAKELKAYRV